MEEILLMTRLEKHQRELEHFDMEITDLNSQLSDKIKQIKDISTNPDDLEALRDESRELNEKIITLMEKRDVAVYMNMLITGEDFFGKVESKVVNFVTFHKKKFIVGTISVVFLWPLIPIFIL